MSGLGRRSSSRLLRNQLLALRGQLAPSLLRLSGIGSNLMPERSDREVAEIVRRLCRYVGANPRACDTLSGIARWWLVVEPDEVPLQEALNWMIAHEVMEELIAADRRHRYRRTCSDAQLAAALDGLADSEGRAR